MSLTFEQHKIVEVFAIEAVGQLENLWLRLVYCTFWCWKTYSCKEIKMVNLFMLGRSNLYADCSRFFSRRFQVDLIDSKPSDYLLYDLQTRPSF